MNLLNSPGLTESFCRSLRVLRWTYNTVRNPQCKFGYSNCVLVAAASSANDRLREPDFCIHFLNLIIFLLQSTQNSNLLNSSQLKNRLKSFAIGNPVDWTHTTKSSLRYIATDSKNCTKTVTQLCKNCNQVAVFFRFDIFYRMQTQRKAYESSDDPMCLLLVFDLSPIRVSSLPGYLLSFWQCDCKCENSLKRFVWNSFWLAKFALIVY